MGINLGARIVLKTTKGSLSCHNSEEKQLDKGLTGCHNCG